MKQLEIRPCVVVHTAHIPAEDAAMANHHQHTTLFATDYGFVMYLHDTQHGPSYVLSEGLWALTQEIRRRLRACGRQSIRYVFFDCDAEAWEGVPTYEW